MPNSKNGQMKFLELKIPPPIIGLIIGCGMWGIANLFPVLSLPGSARIVAWLLIVAGFVLNTAGVITVRRANSTISPMKPETATSLVTAGVYRFTRNPMYLGILIVLVGWAIYLLAPLTLIGPVLFWLYINRFQIVPEERVLSGLFGDRFVAYKSSVRRWI